MPRPVVNTCPATPEVFRMRMRRRMLPWATMEYSSPVAGSFKNREPRSAESSQVDISTRASSISSRVSSAARRWDTPSSMSDWDWWPGLYAAWGAAAAGAEALADDLADDLAEIFVVLTISSGLRR